MPLHNRGDPLTAGRSPGWPKGAGTCALETGCGPVPPSTHSYIFYGTARPHLFPLLIPLLFRFLYCCPHALRSSAHHSSDIRSRRCTPPLPLTARSTPLQGLSHLPHALHAPLCCNAPYCAVWSYCSMLCTLLPCATPLLLPLLLTTLCLPRHPVPL